MKTLTNIIAAIAFVLPMTVGAATSYNAVFTSPNGRTAIKINDTRGNNPIEVTGNNRQAFTIARLGIVANGDTLECRNLSTVTTAPIASDDYLMATGKRSKCFNQYKPVTLHFMVKGHEMNVEMRVYDDGVALRYVPSQESLLVTDELTTYKVGSSDNRWLQTYDPGYERFFPLNPDNAKVGQQWGYPALMETPDGVWTLFSESDIRPWHAASRLTTVAPDTYRVSLAENSHVQPGQWQSPWRLAIIGNLSDIVESTLVTDLAPAAKFDADWVKPGVVSWIYWAYNRGSKDYQIVKQYIDMAHEMGLPYMLIDWEWDVMGNGGTFEDALRYANERNVKLLLWYNSSTAWTTNGAGGPLFKLNAEADREKEFAWLESLGVAGVKIDFFSGDTQETMKYCTDLLESAARHNLLINFHGATIPRGWQRTYPNFMSAEAVYGAEWYNNAPVLTNRAAAHNATLPFTRNVVGPMDYTPCTFSDSQHPHITTHAHELALTVLFESGLQHLADKPESYLAQPRKIIDFLSNIPSVWDNSWLLTGYPGDHVVMARQSGDTMYIAGINGRDEAISVSPDWSRIDGFDAMVAELYADSPDGAESAWTVSEIHSLPESIEIKPRGGFVIKLTR